jgi:hypothetical protein
MAARMFLLCRTSRMTIMRVRRTLSETEIEKYGRPKLMATEFQMLLFGLRGLVDEHDTHRYINDVSPERCRRFVENSIRTHRGKVHEAGEGDDPEVHGVDYVATIELGGGAGVRHLGERTQHQTKN